MELKNKILSPELLAKRIEFWRTMGDTIVFTNGCFDIIHPGHIHLLQECAKAGDRLIVGLNSDASVKRLKGPSRPVNNEQSRVTVLAALQFTDAIVLFEEDTPENLIHEVSPDVLIKGGDWNTDEIVGSDFVQSYGGKVSTVQYLKGHSTTEIIRKIGK
jgi:D-beta-D-heptose 7-phosphate kinase/D-beta-D-heptose 1-phosphate adenosyltransferase